MIMSVRKRTTNRRTLFRTCGTCGRSIVTTADTPWIRMIERDGKRQAITYFCCEKCYAASYKHIGCYDGKAEQRRKERESYRDRRAYKKQYYAAHAEQEREKARVRYWADPGAARAACAYQRRKKALVKELIK